MLAKFRRFAETRSFARIFTSTILICLIFVFLAWNYELIKLNRLSQRFKFLEQLTLLSSVFTSDFLVYPQQFSRVYNNREFKGRNFSLENVYLAASMSNFTLYNQKGDILTDLDVLKSDPVFVSGFSDNHAYEGFVMLHKMRDVYKGQKKVVVYDLGLRYQFSLFVCFSC